MKELKATLMMNSVVKYELFEHAFVRVKLQFNSYTKIIVITIPSYTFKFIPG